MLRLAAVRLIDNALLVNDFLWILAGDCLRDTIMPDDLARTDSPLAEPVQRTFPARARSRRNPALPAGHGILYPSAGPEDDPGTATDLGRVIETVVSPFHCL